MILLSNEEELVSSNEGKVILTNRRIHMKDREWGSSYSITIFLEDISSIEMRYKSYIWLVALAAITGLLCSYFLATEPDRSETRWCFVATIMFLLLYWFSRKHIVSITPDGGKPLNFEVTRLSEYDMEQFIAKVQEAKMQRIIDLTDLRPDPVTLKR